MGSHGPHCEGHSGGCQIKEFAIARFEQRPYDAAKMSTEAFGVFFSSVAAGALVWMIGFKAVGGEAGAPGLVPLPLKMEVGAGVFKLQAWTRILVDAKAAETGRYLAERLGPATGWSFQLGAETEPPGGNILLLSTTRRANPALGAEGYELIVTEDFVVIRAPGPAGLFYGVQSLLQLLPPTVFGAKPAGRGDWTIQCVRIEDQPRFEWRGLLLDVSRHFFTKDEVKELLDLMALHKLNRLQMHLTDDQGWRIEIKSYPRLTEVGAWRKGIGFGLDPKASTAYGPDGRYGGYYTQADLRELVAYGAARHITIVPEIEMPGHASAALAAYPRFSCSGKGYTTDGGIFPGVYCPGNEETFEFLQSILAEVIELFPGKYIHIGGDEVPKGNWQKCAKCQARKAAEGLKDEKELQSYFVRRLEKFINSKGRSLIGWSEILEGGLAQNAAVMDWIGGGAEAAGAGHDVVMTPTTHCYFDYYQSKDQAAEPRAIGGFLPLDQVYSLEPMPAKLEARYQSHILGAQGNLWTEYVPSFKHSQYMIFPRLCALAEVAWSAKSSRNYADFARRLRAHLERLDQLGVNYRKGIPGE
jgi:hexosaminidase